MVGKRRQASDQKLDQVIRITPSMERAGVDVLLSSGRMLTDYQASSDSLLVREIFHAMLSALSRGKRRQRG